MNIHEPSASTNPLRSAEKGRDALSGASFHNGVSARSNVYALTVAGLSGASTPPARIIGRVPIRIWSSAYPSASVEEVQFVVTTWLGPRNPKRMEISLESVPIVPDGIQKTLACLTCPVCHNRYCSSVNSC